MGAAKSKTSVAPQAMARAAQQLGPGRAPRATPERPAAGGRCRGASALTHTEPPAAAATTLLGQVSMARVYNWDVANRRAGGAAAS